MSPSLSRWLSAALLLALPLQAFAGAGGLCAGASHGEDHPGRTHFSIAHDAASADPRSDEDQASAKGVHHDADCPCGGSHCASCVGCCTGGAISSIAASILTDGSGVPVVREAPVSFSGVLLDPLDPPPLAL